MIEKDISLYVLLILSLFLFPVVANYNQRSSLFLFSAVFVCASVFHLKTFTEENYERMDFFPWNEANLVKKRDPNSTVIDCAWYLDQKKNNNLFKMSDPVVSEYDNQPSP